jgi:hypothetical protein
MIDTAPDLIPARLTWHHEQAARDVELHLDDGALDEITFAHDTELPPLVRAVTFEPAGGTRVGILAWLILDADTEDSLGLLEIPAGAGA